MDTLADTIIGLDNDGLDHAMPVNMSADDVMILGHSATCTEWAQEKGMTWSVQKCTVIANDEENPVFLSGSRMKHRTEAEYLGVSIDKGGVTTTKTIDRLRSARSRIGLLSTLGMFKRGFTTERNVAIFRAFIRQVFEYGVHLVQRRQNLIEKP